MVLIRMGIQKIGDMRMKWLCISIFAMTALIASPAEAFDSSIPGGNTRNIEKSHCERGPRGPKGKHGHHGIPGPMGPQGLQGAIGPQGVQGGIGLQGVQGVIGPQGGQGDQGVIGPQGLQGLVGLTGTAGATGETGATGATGATGETGATGATGSTGVLSYAFVSLDQIDTSLPVGASGGIAYPVPFNTTGPRSDDIEYDADTGTFTVQTAGVYTLQYDVRAFVNINGGQNPSPPIDEFVVTVYQNGGSLPMSVVKGMATTDTLRSIVDASGQLIVNLNANDTLCLMAKVTPVGGVPDDFTPFYGVQPSGDDIIEMAAYFSILRIN